LENSFEEFDGSPFTEIDVLDWWK